MNLEELRRELERLEEIIESSEVQGEIDAAWSRVSELSSLRRTLAIEDARANGLEYIEPLTPEQILPAWDQICTIPDIVCSGRSLVLRYLTPDKAQISIKFGRVRFFSLGEPTFDGLQYHELWERGLDQLLAGRIINSKRIASLNELAHSAEQRTSHHFIFCFHDETFECVATGFEVAQKD